MSIFLSIKIVVILAIFAQIFLPAIYLKVLAFTKYVGKEQYIGKYQLCIDNVTNFRYSRMQIKFKGLDEMPTDSTIENNGRILKIEFNCSTVPTVEVDLKDLGVAGTFRLNFLYFQWLKRTSVEAVFKAQLHAVFYDENAKSYDEAKQIAQVRSFEEVFLVLLQNYLKNVREPNRKSAITNISLKYWNQSINRKYLKYYAYEGSFSEFHCQGTVTWIDLELALVIEDQTIRELKKLKSNTGEPLMSQVSEFVKPNGTVYTSTETTVLAMPGLRIGVLFLIFYSY